MVTTTRVSAQTIEKAIKIVRNLVSKEATGGFFTEEQSVVHEATLKVIEDFTTQAVNSFDAFLQINETPEETSIVLKTVLVEFEEIVKRYDALAKLNPEYVDRAFIANQFKYVMVSELI